MPGSQRILLLEDHHEVAEALIAALVIRGHTVDHALTVAAALAVYEVDRYDLIVVDWEVPDGTGADLLSQIRGCDKAVTVLFSGLDRTAELAALDLTVDHVCSKGNPGELLDLVDAGAPV